MDRKQSEWRTSILTASGLLITVPVLGLSTLASNPDVPRYVIVFGLIPITIASTLLAISMYLIIRLIDREIFGLGMHINIESLIEVVKNLSDNETRREMEQAIATAHSQAIRDLPKSYGESGRLSRLGNHMFGAWLLFLIISLVGVVTALAL